VALNLGSGRLRVSVLAEMQHIYTIQAYENGKYIKIKPPSFEFDLSVIAPMVYCNTICLICVVLGNCSSIYGVLLSQTQK